MKEKPRFLTRKEIREFEGKYVDIFCTHGGVEGVVFRGILRYVDPRRDVAGVFYSFRSTLHPMINTAREIDLSRVTRIKILDDDAPPNARNDPLPLPVREDGRLVVVTRIRASISYAEIPMNQPDGYDK